MAPLYSRRLHPGNLDALALEQAGAARLGCRAEAFRGAGGRIGCGCELHAAVEAAAGALSRAFAGATVESSETWVRDAVTPVVLAQMGVT